jgi:hypothetical protein
MLLSLLIPVTVSIAIIGFQIGLILISLLCLMKTGLAGSLNGETESLLDLQRTWLTPARFIANGGTYNSYYMYHGGTNFARDAGYAITTSYDYDAQLNEYGFPSETNIHI